MSEYWTYKKWRLREGAQESVLVGLVRNEISAHYAQLDRDVRLGLLRFDTGPSYLAIQRWPDRERFLAATTSESYQAWFRAYEPILQRWDGLVEFESEWEGEELLG